MFQFLFDIQKSIVIYHINRIKNKKSHVRKGIWQKSNILSWLKKIKIKLRPDRKYLNTIKGIYEKFPLTLYLVNTQSFPLLLGIRQRYLLSPLLVNIVWKAPAKAIRQGNVINHLNLKGVQTAKTISKKHDRIGYFTLSDFKTYHRATIIIMDSWNG